MTMLLLLLLCGVPEIFLVSRLCRSRGGGGAAEDGDTGISGIAICILRLFISVF